MHIEIESVKELTNQLINYNQQITEIYVKTKESNKDANFYTEVKPFADNVHRTALKWKKAASKWLQHAKINYLHPQQIEDTYENLLIVSVKAFQKTTRPKRFREMTKSIDYVLNTISLNLKLD